MTGQSLLDRMELLNQELQLQSGEDDVTRGLVALNVAQDYFETLLALRPNTLGSGTGTVNTSASTETTTYPANLLRIDRLQLLDASSLPEYDLRPIQRVGGHRTSNYWPWNIISTTSTSGKPTRYWANGSLIYWSPLPNGTHTVRWYGLQAATDITAGGTFLYPDIVALPIASFATRLMRLGVDDPTMDYTQLANEVFTQVLDTLSYFRRDEPQGFTYSQTHTE